jgi:hypothetical protein
VVALNKTALQEELFMKKIVLIGDSIRMGYDKYVRAALDGKAEVLFPEENSRFAEYVLRTVIDWKNNGKWGDDVDVVHWNAGLWDTLTLYEDGTLTPLNVYVDFIKRIHKRLTTLFPKAKLIFATSTPVLEDKYPDHKISVRYNADTRAFNAAAAAALTELGEETARKVYDRHRILTEFLTSIGVPEEVASEDACKIEHHISDESFEAIKKQVEQ